MASWPWRTHWDENTYWTNRQSALSLLPPTPLRNYHRTVPNIRSRHSHCNASDKGSWKRSSSLVMQYTRIRRIPTHPNFPKSLYNSQVPRIRNWTVCRWVGKWDCKNNVCKANDKTPSWEHHQPAGKMLFTRGCVRELKNARKSVTVQNRTHVYMKNFLIIRT